MKTKKEIKDKLKQKKIELDILDNWLPRVRNIYAIRNLYTLRQTILAEIKLLKWFLSEDKSILSNKKESTYTDKELIDKYKEFKNSDILEGNHDGMVLAFLYYLKRGNLEGKSFNPNYHKNIEKDPLKARFKELKYFCKEELPEPPNTEEGRYAD